MPVFINREWFGYKVLPYSGDRYRKLVKRIFRYDILPYLYGSHLIIDLTIIPPTVVANAETLTYEWRLYSSDNRQAFQPRAGTIEILPNKETKIRLVTDLILIPTQYMIDFKLNKGSESGQAKTLAVLTVQDRDDFYRNTLIPILTGVFGIVLGTIFGIVVMKLLGM